MAMLIWIILLGQLEKYSTAIETFSNSYGVKIQRKSPKIKQRHLKNKLQQWILIFKGMGKKILLNFWQQFLTLSMKTSRQYTRSSALWMNIKQKQIMNSPKSTMASIWRETIPLLLSFWPDRSKQSPDAKNVQMALPFSTPSWSSTCLYMPNPINNLLLINVFEIFARKKT